MVAAQQCLCPGGPGDRRRGAGRKNLGHRGEPSGWGNLGHRRRALRNVLDFPGADVLTWHPCNRKAAAFSPGPRFPAGGRSLLDQTGLNCRGAGSGTRPVAQRRQDRRPAGPSPPSDFSHLLSEPTALSMSLPVLLTTNLRYNFSLPFLLYFANQEK